MTCKLKNSIIFIDMIILITVFIIILTIALVIGLKKLDERVIRYHSKFIGDAIALVEEIKDVRKSLHDANRIARLLMQPKIKKMLKIVSKGLDVLSVLLLFTPSKNKVPLVKKILSARFLKYAYSLYKTVTA